jgi:hypothetical protein
VAGAAVDVGSFQQSGWSVRLVLSPSGFEGSALSGDERRAVVSTVDRSQFVGALLKDEAALLDHVGGRSGTDGPWAPVAPGDVGALDGEEVDLVGTVEEPLSALLQRAMQQRARSVGGALELRNAEAALVSGWVASGEFDAAVVTQFDAPTVCWLCRWGAVDEDLARRADAGDEGAVDELERRLRDEAFVLPLWRPRPVVAWREAAVSGVAVNGFGLLPAWNADQWWQEGGAGAGGGSQGASEGASEGAAD